MRVIATYLAVRRIVFGALFAAGLALAIVHCAGCS